MASHHDYTNAIREYNRAEWRINSLREDLKRAGDDYDRAEAAIKKLHPIMTEDLRVLGLSERTERKIRNVGCTNVMSVVLKFAGEYAPKGLGGKVKQELVEAFEKHGIHLTHITY